MGKHCAHLAHAAITATTYIVVTIGTMWPFRLTAQPQTAPVGIDPKLFAAANAGDSDSQLRVAHAYAKGNGVSQDFKQAAVWLKKAADAGRFRADYILGEYYRRGLGVPQDDSQAVLWYRKAADHGDSDAEYEIGLHYENGTGLPKDFGQAADWYRKAAENGNSNAQFHLGQLYDSGHGVLHDEGIAAAWFSQAASHGNLYAQTRLEWLKKEQESRLQLRSQAETAGVWILVALCVLAALWRFRIAVITLAKRLHPKTTRAKQLAAFLIAGSWCSVCCVYQFCEMWRPVEAAVKALLLCAPALVFGATSFWWLSQPVPRKQANPTTDSRVHS